jgi:dephospho-CoA kinase
MKQLSLKIFWLIFALTINSVAGGCGWKTQPFPDSPQPPAQVTAAVDKASANPGDIITFTLSAEHNQNVAVTLPEIADKLSDFRIVNSGSLPPEKKGSRILESRWYKLQADTAGSYVIEPVEVALRLPGGEHQTVKTPKLFVEITSLLQQEGGAQDIRDIKPPVSVFPSLKTFLPVVAALAGIAAAFLLGMWLFGRYRRKRAARAVARKPAHEEALESLENLLKKNLVEQERFQEFCFEISFILRTYLESRFRIPAVDFTTEEILKRVNERDGVIDGEMKPLLAEFLTDTDLVKFAKHQPSAEEIAKIIRDTMTFIQKTALVATEKEPASGPGKKVHEHVPV